MTAKAANPQPHTDFTKKAVKIEFLISQHYPIEYDHVYNMYNVVSVLQNVIGAEGLCRKL